MTADTAVLILAREKLSRVSECLDAVMTLTTGDFHVYLVDVGYPRDLLAPLERRARESTKLTIVSGGTAPVLANAALNLALAASKEPFVCVVENDVVVSPDYWHPMRQMLGSGSYDLVSPTIWDGRTSKIHFDPPVSRIERIADGGYQSDLVRRPKNGIARVPGPRPTCHLEKHCFAGTREAMERLQPFDEAVLTRTDIDLSLTAFHIGLRVGMCPSSEVTFHGPPISEVDHEFFAYRWDLERAVASNERVERKWKLGAAGDYLKFVHEMREFI
jgi:GT2 family glycosyltransferase